MLYSLPEQTPDRCQLVQSAFCSQDNHVFITINICVNRQTVRLDVQECRKVLLWKESLMVEGKSGVDRSTRLLSVASVCLFWSFFKKYFVNELTLSAHYPLKIIIILIRS